ncbi:MAG: radical SAM protein [Candidatus Eremiobacteraeota bacterium]|nr:radical SAM protein [Candidatus Eremiobacteraeota bacterium]
MFVVYYRAMRGVEVVEQAAKSVINPVKGMPFAWSINPYRGCYHQCVFCYARRTHWFLDEDGIDRWGSRIFVKVNAPAVVRREVARRSWKREYVAIGTVTDPYQPLEGRYRLTRGILEALADFETPAGLITRSPLVVRDLDVLARLARVAGASVSVSIATTDAALARQIEPTVAPPAQRLRTVETLASSGIRVNVALAPILPGITDSAENIASVVRAARGAGAAHVWHSTLYLHDVTREAYFAYLRERHPELVESYERAYRGKYAPSRVTRPIDQRFDAAIRAYPKVARDFIAPNGPRQISLL